MSIIYRIFFVTTIVLFNANSMLAQPNLTAEINNAVSPIIEQLNSYPDMIKSVAIADFTDLANQPNQLGKQLAEEFQVAFVMNTTKKFMVIDRSRLKTLMEEVKLDGQGVLAPEMTPKLGRLRGIDVIIGATMSPTPNDVRLTIKGIHLETGGIVAAANGKITLTPSLKNLIKENSIQPIHNPANTNSEQSDASNLFIKENLKVEAKGCNSSNNQVACNFNVTSEHSDSQLSVYNTRSRVIPSEKTSSGVMPSKIQIGDRAGDSRITKILHSGESTEMIVFFTPQSSLSSDDIKIELSCFSDQLGVFTITFNNLSVIH